MAKRNKDKKDNIAPDHDPELKAIYAKMRNGNSPTERRRLRGRGVRGLVGSAGEGKTRRWGIPLPPGQVTPGSRRKRMTPQGFAPLQPHGNPGEKLAT
jgi:hypothetical protein